jgi:hypothetical protein
MIREERILSRDLRSGNGRRTGCSICGQPPEAVVEVVVSEMPEPGAGRPRGKLVKTKSRRMCAKHAAQFFNAMDPRR